MFVCIIYIICIYIYTHTHTRTIVYVGSCVRKSWSRAKESRGEEEEDLFVLNDIREGPLTMCARAQSARRRRRRRRRRGRGRRKGWARPRDARGGDDEIRR